MCEWVCGAKFIMKHHNESCDSEPAIVYGEKIKTEYETKQKGISLKEIGNHSNIDPGYHQVVQFSSTTI